MMNSLCLVKKKSREGGFAILEALIAITVFTIGVLAVLSMQTASVMSNDNARGVTEQSTLAADLVERLMPLPYNHADLADGAHPPIVQGSYTISWTVDDDAMIPDTKTITVTVVWNVPGIEKSVNLICVKPDTI